MKFLLILCLLMSCSHRDPYAPVPIPGSLKEAVSSAVRDPENVKRDRYLHPLETLNFFGLRPSMTVVEVAPGAGYFSEILAPYLAKDGQYVMAVARMSSRPTAIQIENERKLQSILLRNQQIQIKSRFIPLEPLDDRNKTKASYADMVLVINLLHNWEAKKSTDASLKFCFDVLKRGGVLGIVQHRIGVGKKNYPMSGYMTEKEVIDLVTQAGFKLISKSEMNANPKDLANYPKGVWTLPPFFRLGETNRKTYEAIGESDRMTLKFIKP